MNGQIAIQLCAFGNICPMGYVCEGRGCCIEPLPLCPNGGRATQRCSRGVDCPPGFGCTGMGGCCLLSLEPVCPSNQNAICQSSQRAYDQIPGTTCQSNSQCNGYRSNGAQCMQSICVCINGAASNGATCQQLNPATLLQVVSARR
ncbi:unnamed protein product [Gongylonema pulchrum]|uniref:EB domain-containing protein n=1 Tax=Gongylonema pulchrum TaxID=637853 RepID=A0A183D9Z2_9BILA|nr:unnamed protein product [Gongylonema pulchrum]